MVSKYPPHHVKNMVDALPICWNCHCDRQHYIEKRQCRSCRIQDDNDDNDNDRIVWTVIQMILNQLYGGYIVSICNIPTVLDRSVCFYIFIGQKTDKPPHG